MSYLNDINELRAYLASGPVLDSNADAVILLYKVFKELDRLDTLEPLLSIKDHLATLETDVQTLVNSQLADIPGAIQEAVQDLVPTKTIYVSTGGDDNNSGNKLAPVRSLSVAVEKAIALNPTLTSPVQIRVHTGSYIISAPLILPRNISLVGDSYNSVEIRPTNETKNNNLILVDSNSTIQNITFSNHQNGAFAVAFNSNANNSTINATGLGAYIQRPVYITDCISITASIGDVVEKLIVNNELSGGAIEVDGNKCAPNSPIKAMVVNNFKAENYNGLGFLVKNSAQLHLTKCLSSYVRYHLKCESGGVAFTNTCINNYGLEGLVASGYNTVSEGSGVASGLESQTTLTVTNLSENTKLYKGSLVKTGVSPNYKLYLVRNIVSSGLNQFTLTLDSPLEEDLNNSAVTFHKRSKIFSTNHYFNHVGSGIDSRAWPENRTNNDRSKHVIELNNGSIIYTSVDNEGNINLNKAITIDGVTGEVTISNVEVLGLENLQANFQLNEDNEIVQNITNTVDGTVPRPFSFNPYNFTSEQIQLLADRINGGSTYQIFVDIDNPNASDSKHNRGNTAQRPFRTLERALIETARRSFSSGTNNDIYNRVSIYVAPGIYHLNNGKGGVIENQFYNRFQDASNLVQINQEEIANSAYNSLIFLNDDTLELRTSLKSCVLSVINAIVDDLSSLGNKQTVTLARSFVKATAPDPGTQGFTQENFLAPYYFNLLVDRNGNLRNNSLLGGLINTIFQVRDQAILAVQNKGVNTLPNITLDPEEDEDSGILACANVVTAIQNYADILIETLSGLINPYNININIGNGPRQFPEEGEPTDYILQSFNDPIEPGIILPRGVSIIGADLRKVIFKPKYVPAPFDNNVGRSSIFRMTGGNFFQGFTVMDQDKQFRDNEPGFSHHKLSAFAFCTLQDLELYYNAVTLAFADRKIYNKAQDASNLIEANYDWLIKKLTVDIESVHPNNKRFGEIFNAQLPYYIQAIIYDLKQLGKIGSENFSRKFREFHIIPLSGTSRTSAISFYKTQITNSFNYFIQAINNLANEEEGGVRDYRIIYDNDPTGQCTDVVSAINNYLNIIKNIIQGSGSTNLINDRFAVSDAESRELETSIVIPNNLSDVNTVQGASPYIFSASVRSEYGMCGIDGDGSKVTGLKSYLAAQFTIISLQKDNRVFITTDSENEINPSGRFKGSRLVDSTDCRHFGYRVTNQAYSQLVSCFCICPAIHYWADNGGEFSITNSTSNFGDVSLYAERFGQDAYDQDTDIALVGIIKPASLPHVLDLDVTKADTFILGNIQSFTQVSSTIYDITLSGLANYQDLYPIAESDRDSFVYVSSATPTPRRAKVISLTTNSNNKSVIRINTAANVGGRGVWHNNINDVDDLGDSVVVGKQLYILRYVDTREALNREYRLILKRSKQDIDKRRPPLHYIIQNNDENYQFELDINTPRSMFYVLDIKNSEVQPPLLSNINYQLEELYETQIATLNRDLFGNIEFDLDLSLNSKIDLNYDAEDDSLLDALDVSINGQKTYSRVNLEKFLDTIGLSSIKSQLDITANPIIDLRARNISLNFHKPSIIRCGGQTWEYMGYYNYSTALPTQQRRKLGDRLTNPVSIQQLQISKTQTILLGGRIYATGMDEEGNSYVGNTIIDLKTGKQEQIIRGSSTEVINIAQPDLSPNWDRINIGVELTISNTANLSINGTVTGLPEAREDIDGTNSDEFKGVAAIANDTQVLNPNNDTHIVTPKKLDKWRISNKIVSLVSKVTKLYVSDRSYHSRTQNRTATNQQGNSVTWEDVQANENNPIDGNVWQFDNPSAANFRCFKSLRDVSLYGNANFSTNDIITLVIDAGYYRADYEFKFGVKINGTNDGGETSWGNPDGSDIVNNKGVILYTTMSPVKADIIPTIEVFGRGITFNSVSETDIKYVHFWTWMTAAKNPNTSWNHQSYPNFNIKKVGETTIEQLLQNADQWAFATYPTELRSKYNSAWAGFDRSYVVIHLKGTGTKRLKFCTFSGMGVSSASINRGGTYQGGYITVYDSCRLDLGGAVIRGNEEIRVSDKRGRNVLINNIPVYRPNNGIITDSMTFADIYKFDGSFDIECIGKNTGNVRYLDTSKIFHDPYNNQWVSVGFCDYFIGVTLNCKVDLVFHASGFAENANYFGNGDIFSSINTVSALGVASINNDKHNIRLEKNTGKLFDLIPNTNNTFDDRLINTVSNNYAFRGTNNLGKKINELYPPVINIDAVTQTADESQRNAFVSWVQALIDQGPMIEIFLYSRFNFSVSIPEYAIWPDRDSSGLIRGQGFLGTFGYRPNISNIKLHPIQSYDLLNNPNSAYGLTIRWNLDNINSSLVTGAQYHQNLFRPIWKGFTLGKYQYPIVIDVGADYSTYANAISAGNYSTVHTPIQAKGYTLDGSNVGATFVLIGTTQAQALAVTYFGYRYTDANRTTKEYFFLNYGNASIVATHYYDLGQTDFNASQHITAKSVYNATTNNQGRIFETISDLLTAAIVINFEDREKVYIRQSNLFLTLRTNSTDSTSIDQWNPVSIDVGNIITHNAFNMGLIGNLYGRGFYVDKLGVLINNITNPVTNSSQTPIVPVKNRVFTATVSTEFKFRGPIVARISTTAFNTIVTALANDTIEFNTNIDTFKKTYNSDLWALFTQRNNNTPLTPVYHGLEMLVYETKSNPERFIYVQYLPNEESPADPLLMGYQFQDYSTEGDYRDYSGPWRELITSYQGYFRTYNSVESFVNAGLSNTGLFPGYYYISDIGYMIRFLGYNLSNATDPLIKFLDGISGWSIPYYFPNIHTTQFTGTDNPVANTYYSLYDPNYYIAKTGGDSNINEAFLTELINYLKSNTITTLIANTILNRTNVSSANLKYITTLLRAGFYSHQRVSGFSVFHSNINGTIIGNLAC